MPFWRIIPALAGNTCRPRESRTQCMDHPRSRGEYICPIPCTTRVLGSSPLSRGIPTDAYLASGGVRIIPALAGNTQGTVDWDIARMDHPRSRGEYVQAAPLLTYYGGSSPLSRGIRFQGRG